MIRSIFVLAFFVSASVIGLAPIAAADHHEGASPDVAAPVEPAQDKMEGDEAAEAKPTEKAEEADDSSEDPAPAAPARPE